MGGLKHAMFLIPYFFPSSKQEIGNKISLPLPTFGNRFKLVLMFPILFFFFGVFTLAKQARSLLL